MPCMRQAPPVLPHLTPSRLPYTNLMLLLYRTYVSAAAPVVAEASVS